MFLGICTKMSAATLLSRQLPHRLPATIAVRSGRQYANLVGPICSLVHHTALNPSATLQKVCSISPVKAVVPFSSDCRTSSKSFSLLLRSPVRFSSSSVPHRMAPSTATRSDGSRGLLSLAFILAALGLVLFSRSDQKAYAAEEKCINQKEPVGPFVGRERELKNMLQYFAAGHTTGFFHSEREEEVKVCLLAGPSGSGKTALALHYAKNEEKKYDFIIFVDCSSQEEFRICLEKASALSHESHKRSLYVFDNVRTQAMVIEIQKVISRKAQSDVIITTDKIDSLPAFTNSLRITLSDTLEVDQSLALFCQTLHPGQLDAFQKHAKVDQEAFVFRFLGGKLLAIKLAAIYFNNQRLEPSVPLALDRYSKAAKEKKQEIQPLAWFEECRLPPDKLKEMKTTFKIAKMSVAAIGENYTPFFSGVETLAQDILYFLSFAGTFGMVPYHNTADTRKTLVEIFLRHSRHREYRVDPEQLPAHFNRILEMFHEFGLIEKRVDAKQRTLIVVPLQIKLAMQYDYHLNEDRKFFVGPPQFQLEYLRRLAKYGCYSIYQTLSPGHFKETMDRKLNAWFFEISPYFNAQTADNFDGLHLEMLESFLEFMHNYQVCDPLQFEFINTLKIWDLMRRAVVLPNNQNNHLFSRLAHESEFSFDPKKNSNAAEAEGHLGWLYLDQDLSKAEDYFTRAFDAGYTEARLDLGIVYLRKAQLEQQGSLRKELLERAQHHFDAVIVNTPTCATAFYGRSSCANLLGRHEEAKRDLGLAQRKEEVSKGLEFLHRQSNFPTLSKKYKELIETFLSKEQAFDYSEQPVQPRYLFAKKRTLKTMDDQGLLFAKMLNLNSTIRTLCLSGCQLSDDALAAIGLSLQHNHTLITLKIENNDSISDEGVTALALALQTNTSLQELSLSGSPEITKRAVKVLLEKAPPQLKTITLSRCPKIKKKVDKLSEKAREQGIDIIF